MPNIRPAQAGQSTPSEDPNRTARPSRSDAHCAAPPSGQKRQQWRVPTVAIQVAHPLPAAEAPQQADATTCDTNPRSAPPNHAANKKTDGSARSLHTQPPTPALPLDYADALQTQLHLRS